MKNSKAWRRRGCYMKWRSMIGAFSEVVVVDWCLLCQVAVANWCLLCEVEVGDWCFQCQVVVV